MITKDFRIVKIEGYSVYPDKYNGLSRKMYVEVVDVYDEDINFVAFTHHIVTITLRRAIRYA